MSDTFKGSLCILLGATLLGTLGTTQALAPAGANPLSIGPIRLLGGSVLLLLWNLLHEGVPSLAGWNWKRLVIAAAGLAGYQVFFFKACVASGVAVGTVVAVGAIPIAAGLMGYLVLKERPGRAWYLATACALLGIVFLAKPGLSQPGGADAGSVFGLISAVLSAFSYSVYLVTVKPLLGKHGPTQILALVLFLGGGMLLPLMLAQPLAWMFSLRGLLVAGHLALFTCAIALVLMLYGLKLTSAATTATLGLAEPLCAALFGLLLLKEPLTTATVFGLAALFLSMAVLVLAPLRSRRAHGNIRRPGPGKA